MPTNLKLASQTFQGMDQILWSSHGLRSPRSISMDQTYVAADVNGNKIIAPGSIISKLGSGLGRVFPAIKATAATTTGQAVITAKYVNSIKVGDVLEKENGDPIGTVSAVNVDAGTVTLAANSTTAIAIDDFIVGDTASAGESIGIIVATIDIAKLSDDLAVYTSASVHGARMPYWPQAMKDKFPEITLAGTVL